MSIFENSYLWFSSLLSLSLSLASTMSALLISIPNRHSRSVYLVPFITICTWAIYLFYHYFTEGLSSPGEGILCLRDVLMFSLVPGILLMRIISQGSVLQSGVAGGFSLLGAAGLGAFGAQFTCRDDFALHILAWHFFPIVILTFVGIVVGRKLLNK